MMSAFEPWDEYRHVVRSYNGGWRIGQGVSCHGHSIMEDLAGKISYMQMLVLNVTGKIPPRRLADWLEARQICMSWPDPRIWCNHIGALAGSLRTSSAAATTAGILASDSHAYGGPRTAITGAAFIQQALHDHHQGMSADDIIEKACRAHKGKPHMMGYARPIAKGDERIDAMQIIGKQLGFETGPHLQLAYEIEAALQRSHDESMNLNGYSSAFLSDQGLSGYEISCISATLVASGVTACYVDTMKRPAETFNALRCDDVAYEGSLPRKLKKEHEDVI